MILDQVLSLYEGPEKERKPSKGNPTGSAFGKCAAALALHRYPEIGQPEGYRVRTIMLFEEGDRVEAYLRDTIQGVYPGLVGGVQGLAYFPVMLTASETGLLARHIGGKWGDPHRIWGQIRENFDGAKPYVNERGKLVWRMMKNGPKDPGPGFILDPIKMVLWCPAFIDFTVLLEDIGHAVVEIKSVSNAVFRRLLMGDLDYGKRAQAAGIVEATGLPFVLIAWRKETGHLLEVSYLTTPGGTVRVRLLKGNRQIEEFRVQSGTEIVTTPDGEETRLPPDQDWDMGGVWTPHDPAILDEIGQRVRDVLLWRPGKELKREYGPSLGSSFFCLKCKGEKMVLCGQCKGTGETPKTKRPCGPCGGAKMVQCPKCEGRGQVDEAPLVWQCGYCLAPETPILRRDFTWTAIGDLRPGDALLAFTEEPTSGRYRRLAPAVVEATAVRERQALRITTTAGEVVCSLDHPWLSRARLARTAPTGWVKAKDLGIGWHIYRLADSEERIDWDSADYKLGYIQGLVDGDGHVNREQFWPSFRVKLCDAEPLDRLQAYLREFGVEARRRQERWLKNERRWRPQESVWATRRNRGFELLLDLLDEPMRGREQAGGYLAGIFDAEGWLDHGVRIANTNPEIIDRILKCSEIVGLGFGRERGNRTVPTNPRRKGIWVVGLHSTRQSEAMIRFFSVCRPSMLRRTEIWRGVRKGDGAGRALRGSWATVITIEPVGVRALVDIQTSTKTFIAAGLASHNCPVKQACYGEPLTATGIENAFRLEIANNRPQWIVRRDAWQKAGLSFVTPPSIRSTRPVVVSDDGIPAIV